MHTNTMHPTIEVDDTLHKLPVTSDYSIVNGGVSPHAGDSIHHEKCLIESVCELVIEFSNNFL